MSGSRAIRVPYSGRILVSQLAAYGLAAALENHKLEPFVGHDESGEFTPFVEVRCDDEQLVNAIRASAGACEAAVEADVEPGKSGNDRIPVIRARATAQASALASLAAREALLDELERHRCGLALRLVAGLGAPAVWLTEQSKAAPHRGATALDGVPYNIGSDIVRGSLRRSLPEARDLVLDQLAGFGAPDDEVREESEDRTRWSPPGTRVAPVWQWLASLGLTLLPVGLRAASAARTPGSRLGSERTFVLPVFGSPVSVSRLRALLQLPELLDGDNHSSAGRLRALGLTETLTFPRTDASNGTMVSFSFGLARPRRV